MRHHGHYILLNIITGFVAVSLSLTFLFFHRENFTIVAASIFFIIVCYTDSRYGKVPNLLNASLAITGVVLNTYTSGFEGFLFSLSGLALGIVLLLLPYLAGGFGAGDVKALGALGALIGPYDLLHVFAYMAFFGGGLALLYNLCNRDVWHKIRGGLTSVTASVLSQDINHLKPDKNNTERSLVRFPYATAIAFGYYTFVYRGGII